MGDPDDRQPPGLMRLAGMGAELAGAVLVFVLVGWWIDRSFDTEPWGIVICACLGIIGGLYNLVRTALHEALGVTKPRQGRRGESESRAQSSGAGSRNKASGEERGEP